MIYPANRSHGLRGSRSETPLSVQEEIKDTIVHQLSTPRREKKSLKSLPKGVVKAANSIKHYKTTAYLVPEWHGSLCMETMKDRTQRRELSNPAYNFSSLSHSIASHKLHTFTACFKGDAPLAVQFAVKARAAQIKKWLGATIILTTFFNGVMEISKMAKKVKTLNLAKKQILPKKVREHVNPWSRILDEAQEGHEVQLNALVDKYERNGDSENVAHLKAQNALLPLYRIELRKVLLEYLQWMRAMKKDYTFQKVMENQNDLKDTDGFG